ncbi:MAG: STAS domain-containing protein [Porticoccaceae bacterium]
MGIKVQSKDGGSTVFIEGDMTIYEALAQKEELLVTLNNVKKGDQIEIDLSGVNEMDTAGIQILLLIKKAAEKAKKIVLLIAHSPATLDVIDRYNLTAYFGDPVVISSAGRR